GGRYGGCAPPATDAAGVVAFGAEIRGSGRASRAVIVRDGRGTRAAAASSERVGIGTLVDFFASALDSMSRPDVGPRGQIAFEATLDHGRVPRALRFRR